MKRTILVIAALAGLAPCSFGVSRAQNVTPENDPASKAKAVWQAARDKLDQAAADAKKAAAKAQFASNCLNRSAPGFCLVTGTLAIPFRAELSGKKDILAGVSADAFVGLNLKGNLMPNGWEPTILVYAGYLPTLSATTSNTTGNAGGGAIDFGIGIALPVDTGINPGSNQTVHIGAVIGIDSTSTANKYPYNGKPYMSIFGGLSF